MLTLCYFSPTHTSRTIARAIARGTGRDITAEADVTTTPLTPVTLAADDLLIIAVPVYGGAVAPLAMKRIESLRGTHTPAVAVVVYGGRDYGRAAAELSSRLTENGFIVTAAAAFVGEHSYSTPDTPIASGRPDDTDIEEARALGRQVAEYLRHADAPTPVDATRLPRPKSSWWSRMQFALFVLHYRRQMRKHPVRLAPRVDPALCTACGRCAKSCPAGAIPADRPDTTDAERCIKCCACVKDCPRGARTLSTPFAPVLSRYFARRKENVWCCS